MWSVKHLYILTRNYSTAAKLSEVTEDQIGYSDIMSTVTRLLRKIGFGCIKFNDGREI